jgi:hypothetical protein
MQINKALLDVFVDLYKDRYLIKSEKIDSIYFQYHPEHLNCSMYVIHSYGTQKPEIAIYHIYVGGGKIELKEIGVGYTGKDEFLYFHSKSAKEDGEVFEKYGGEV